MLPYPASRFDEGWRRIPIVSDADERGAAQLLFQLVQAILCSEAGTVFDDPVRSYHGKCHKVPNEGCTSDAIAGVF